MKRSFYTYDLSNKTFFDKGTSPHYDSVEKDFLILIVLYFIKDVGKSTTGHLDMSNLFYRSRQPNFSLLRKIKSLPRSNLS